MKVNIGIPEDHLKAVALELNRVLADEFVLYTKTRNYHWNVEGNNFMEMHKFYESQYEELDVIIDDVAERVRALGNYSDGRLKDFIGLTRLDEPAYTSKQDEQLKNLLTDHEAKAALLGRAYLYPLLAAGEQGVSHILSVFRQQIEEGLAFLGAQSIHDLDPSFIELPSDWRQPAIKEKT